MNESDARRSWLEENARGAASPAVFEADRPAQLAVLGESNLARRLTVPALEQAGQPYEIAYVGGSFAGLVEAAAAGLGVVCWAKRALRATGLHVFDSAPPRLPRVANVHGGVYLRDGLNGAPLDELLDRIAAAIGGSVPEASNPRAAETFSSALRSAGGARR
jgi:DNA-binding transcriptional LysR family regulator